MKQWPQRVYNFYEGLLVSRRGAYSIERVLAFDDYCKQTSTIRVLLVCFAFPLPSLIAILMIEAVPLEDPAAGWRVNYSFWFRTVASVLIVISSLLQIARQIAPELSLSSRRNFAVCAISSAVYVGFLIVLAQLWTYPIPFMIPIGAGPSCFCFFATWIVFTGRARLKSTPKLRERIVLFGRLLASLASLCLIYPTYNAFFVALDGYPWAQNVIVLVLPLLRLLMRNVVANECAYWEDLIPEMTIFSVEVFNSIYVAQSMQTGNSSLMTALVVVVDLGSSVYSLHRVRHRARKIQQCRHEGEQVVADVTSERDFMLPLLARITSSTVDCSTFRVLGSFPHKITPSARRLELLAKMSGQVATTDRFVLTKKGRSAIVPLSSPAPCSQDIPHRRSSLDRKKKTVRVDLSLRLLFQCEYIILAEYVESVVSAVVAVHLAVVFQLPNLQYYPYKASIEPSMRPWILFRVGVFAAIEFASLLFVLLRLRGQLRFSTLHMLAFVLETQYHDAQGKFALWIVVVLQFTLVHYGADFPALLHWIQGGK